MILATLLLAAPQAQELTCPPLPVSNITGPVIRDADTARAIFVAIANQFAGGADWSSMKIKVRGTAADRKWAVFHYQPGRDGVGMSITIDRCTGAISNVHYQR